MPDSYIWYLVHKLVVGVAQNEILQLKLKISKTSIRLIFDRLFFNTKFRK